MPQIEIWVRLSHTEIKEFQESEIMLELKGDRGIGYTAICNFDKIAHTRNKISIRLNYT